ncbi:MAG TPA: HAD-IA family hydrolase [Kiloniellales bacterium]|nr:HAD-IA family hydrolase [Kiloniellales bacterium]
MDQLLQLIVFDYDGTLVDSQAAIVATMQAAFAELQLAEPEPPAVRRQVGLTLERAIARLMHPEEQPEAALHAAVTAAFRRRFQALRAAGGVTHEPLFAGMREVLEALAHPTRSFAIATGKNRRGLVASLAGHRLDHLFAVLKTADDGPSKPHPEILQQAMRETGVGPEQTLMIGDSVYDMEMASNAGAHALGVGWGYHPADELLRHGARAVALHPADLPRLVEDLRCAS